MIILHRINVATLDSLTLTQGDHSSHNITTIILNLLKDNRGYTTYLRRQAYYKLY